MIERPDRGSFAGAWVFPGGKLEPDDGDPAEEAATARRAGVRETWEETGRALDADALVPLSCWDPPPGTPLRIRTWFFLAHDPGGRLVLGARRGRRRRVGAARATCSRRHARGRDHAVPADLGHPARPRRAARRRGAARRRAHRRAPPVRDGRAGRRDGPMLLWHGDAAYDGVEDSDADAAGAASRHRLELASLPWVYTRTG